MQSTWLAAFAPSNAGGAGGPQSFYLQFLQEERIVGQALLQRLPLSGMRFGPNLQANWVSTVLGDEAWQFGQVLFSGVHGIQFLPSISALQLLGEARECLAEANSCTLARTKAKPVQARGTWLVKDLDPGFAEANPRQWWPIDALPELAINIPSTWNSFDDYLAALPSKYRTRIKRARSKFIGLNRCQLNADDLQTKDYSSDIKPKFDFRQNPTFDAAYPKLIPIQVDNTSQVLAKAVMETDGAKNSLSQAVSKDFGEPVVQRIQSLDRLYEQLMERAEYVPFRVEPGYIARLKCLRPEAVELTVYYDHERLVGFSTLLIDGDAALAHLAACNPEYNATHQLYLNMLADLLERAIARGAASLNYGRTATTIKSSLGAEPQRYRSFVAHDGCLRHQVLGPISRRTFQGAEADALIQQPFGRQPIA